MSGCGKAMMQTVPTRYTSKEVPAKCGQTSYNGGIVLCDACERKLHARYPQGWRETPGDLCKHGTYVGDAYGPDYMCGQCESE
jgi:hypothetical protein